MNAVTLVIRYVAILPGWVYDCFAPPSYRINLPASSTSDLFLAIMVLTEGIRLNATNIVSKHPLVCHHVVWVDRPNGASVILFNV